MPAACIARHILTGQNLAIQLVEGRLTAVPTTLEAAPDLYISPGWVDVQVNGFAGQDINSPDLAVEDVSALNARLWQEGVTAWCPTVITAPADQIEHNLHIIDQACRQDAQLSAGVAGIHLEGPYISSAEGTYGAHPPEYIHPPDWAEFERWQAAAGGRIRIVTLAPEQPGAIAFIRRLAERGIVAALGHTRASSAVIREAVAAGACLATHLGNGIEASLPRHANPIWDQLAEDQLHVSLIFDGFHLPANVMKVILRAKGIEKCLLVSDATTLARLEPGVYETPVGGKVQLHPSGRLSLYGTEYLAGSASSLKDGFENSMRIADCTLEQAARLASVNPSRLIGLKQDSIVAFSLTPQRQEVTIQVVSIQGRVTYQNPDWILGG